ncbi:MAG: LuxR C-terminal-related transcriptional regulator [Halioglobus sp.]|nr:LuxR C-terminal-related transcriptional regulator [Halioglobus sp.]
MRLVSAGEMFISRALANRMLERRATNRAIDTNHPEIVLSERELEIFTLIGSGYSTKEIAVRLSLSPKTVDTHRDHVKREEQSAPGTTSGWSTGLWSEVVSAQRT